MKEQAETFGREGSRGSHRRYRCAEALKGPLMTLAAMDTVELEMMHRTACKCAGHYS